MASGMAPSMAPGCALPSLDAAVHHGIPTALVEYIILPTEPESSLDCDLEDMVFMVFKYCSL